MANQPNFFIVGQPKSGTSALYSFLSGHPDVCMGATKEPQFFCTDLVFFGNGVALGIDSGTSHETFLRWGLHERMPHPMR